MKRKVCWVSAGVSSFMAGYIAGDVDDWIYIDIGDQHEDSMRFIKDCEKVIGTKIQILRSSEYETVEDCVRAFGGFKARNGFHPCTNWLKKRVRKQWEAEHQDDDLIYVWGFDAKETSRAEKLIEENPQANHEFPLIDKGLSKADLHFMLENQLGIKRPMMYELGYPNNNCVGCVRGGMGYWNHIRKDFPEVFASRSKLERDMGHSILKQCYLDELDPNRGKYEY